MISGDDQNLPIDLDGDGHVDATISQAMSGNGCFYDFVAAYPSSGDAIVSGFNGLDGPWANALAAGVFIGPADPYTTGGAITTDVLGGFGCPFPHDDGYWGNSGPHYLGIAFTKNGRVRYAWAQLQATTPTGYAYQTIVGRAIPAGRT